jgi:transposase
MQDNNIISFLDLPDLIATELIKTKDKYIFVAENKQKSIKCPECHQVTDKILDRRWQNIKDIPIRNKQVIIRLEKKAL